ncbi:MAG: hypothetical protein V4489_01615 [Chlamydiota bacterium]
MRRNLSVFFLGSLLLSISKLSAETELDEHFSLLTDFVYMQRYHVKNNPIVTDSTVTICDGSDCTSTVLSSKALVRNFEPGISAAFSYIQNATTKYELSGLYIWAMDNTSTREGPGSLSYPFQNASFAKDFYGADKMTARYKSLFYTAEANFWKTFSSIRSMFGLSTLFGLRFANISEKFSVNSYKSRGHSSYDIKADNDLIGVQIGLDFQIRPIKNFYWDLLLKFGVDLNRISAKVSLGDLNNTVILRNNTRQKAQSGVFAQAAAGAGYQLADWLNVHIGYQMLFFGGLALAPDQVDRSSSGLGIASMVNSYTISGNGYIIVHGVYTGFVFAF